MAAYNPSRHIANAAVSRIGPYVPPWLCAGATYGLATAAHTAWSTSPGPAMATAALGAALTWATWKMAPDTAPLWRAHSTLTTMACLEGIAVSTAINPATPGALSAWAILGGGTALSWTIRRAVNTATGQGEQGPKAITGDLVDTVRALKNAKIDRPQVDGGRVRAAIHAPGGVETIQQSTKEIAAALGVGANAVRVQPDPDDASRAELVVVPRDHLRTMTEWPGPSTPGGSITDPVRVGVYEDGTPAELWFPGDPHAGRNACHYGVYGTNGSGKSSGAELAWAEILTRRDVALMLADPVKGAQTLGAYRESAAWVAMSKDECRGMIRALPDMIAARANQLGEWGYKEWTPDVFARHGMPYIVAWFEESAALFRDEIGDDITGLLETARSAGISIVISLQRPSIGTVSGDDREQISGTLCFGVKQSSTARMCLPSEVLAQGAAPEVWSNRRPGYAYLVGPGVDEDRFATPLRTYRLDPARIAEAVEEWAETRAGFDPVTAAACGRSAAAAPARADEPGLAVELPVNHEPDLDDADPDQPIDVPAAPAVAFTEPAAFRMDRDQALDVLAEALEQLRAAGRTTFRPIDLRHVQQRTGYGRTWVTGELKRLVAAGRLEDDDRGTYRFRQPALTP